MEDDPFGSIVGLCLVSSSQEDRLRRCPFALEPGEHLSGDEPPVSGEIPVESTGIVMVSPPESLEDGENENNSPHVLFHTPPEDSLLACSGEQRAVADDRCDDRTVDRARDDKGGEETVAVDDGCRDGGGTVDLGRDTDLGFSEVQLTQTIDGELHVGSSSGVDRVHESEELHCESKKVRVLSGELSPNQGLGESPSKKLKVSEKILNFESPNASVRTVQEKSWEKLWKSFEKLKSKKVSPYNHESPNACLSTGIEKNRDNLLNSVNNSGSISPQDHQTSEICEEGLAKRKLDFSTEVVEPDIGESNGALGFDEETAEKDLAFKEGVENGLSNEVNGEANRLHNNEEENSARTRKNIEDIDKFRYVGPSAPNSHKLEKKFQGLRALPLSVYGPVENAEGRLDSGTLPPKNHREVTLLNVLKILAQGCKYDPSLENVSVLEVAKRRGMTFP